VVLVLRGKEMLVARVATHLITQAVAVAVLVLLVQVQLVKSLGEMVVLAFSGLIVLFTQAAEAVVLMLLFQGQLLLVVMAEAVLAVMQQRQPLVLRTKVAAEAEAAIQVAQ
jgi:hypothetical protein